MSDRYLESNNEALDIFVVSSPYQALSALQARVHFESKNSVLIVGLPSEYQSRSFREIMKVVELSGWDRILYVYPEAKNKLVGVFKRWMILRKLEFLTKVNCRNFFMGDFRVQWIHYFKNLVNPKKSYLLDDGSASITVYKNFFSKGIFYPEKNGKIKKFLERLMYFPFFDKKKQENKISMFTSYSFEDECGVGIVNADFSKLKGHFKNYDRFIDKSQVWFFGSPYSEKRIMKEGCEIAFINSCLSWLKRKKYRVVYVPHRFESKKKLEKISKLSGVEIRKLDIPAEAYFLLSRSTPGSIAAVYSSILETLPKIQVMDNIFSFKLPNSYQNEDIKNVYSYYQENGVKIIDL
mgnify:CR=1 FL=1